MARLLLAAVALASASAPGWAAAQPRVVRGGDGASVVLSGRSLDVPRYPPPRSRYHARARITTAAVDPSGRLVAVAGRCSGYSGVSPVRVPSCAGVFVRVMRVADGAVVRELALPWSLVTDEQRTLALAFSTDGSLVGAYTRMAWSDCSYGGAGGELHVWRLEDGAHLERHELSRSGPWRSYELKLSRTHALVRARHRGRVRDSRVRLRHARTR